MSKRRAKPLDELETRLSRPMRVGLFGHRNVGKTTLLAMLYRQASSGAVPGLRMAAADARTAEYLGEKIARIEAGEPMAGSLAETELNLRLYHGPARLDLIVKDYQGEHVELGADEPIQAFFDDCDAVLLCLDPEGPIDSAERRRRQQEVENLLERYIERSETARTDRPVALVLTKFDRVLAAGPGHVAAPAESSSEISGPAEFPAATEISARAVERLVDERYGMTRHALAEHAPDGAIFGVSSFGLSAVGHRPPAELRPLGLEGPLSWLAERLEARDRDVMGRLWDRAPRDLARLERAGAAYERRYPHSNGSSDFRARLEALRRGRGRRRILRLAASGLIALGGLAGYDALGYQFAAAFERKGDHAAPAIADRWSGFLEWHPTIDTLWPGLARRARSRRAEWMVKAAGVQVANGTAPAGLGERLGGLKDQAPQLAPKIREVERARDLARHEERWKAVRGEAGSLASIDDPDAGLSAIDAFLREFPDTSHRGEALALAQDLKARRDERRFAAERRFVEELARAESLPNVSLADLIERARRFLAERPEGPVHDEVQRRLDRYVRRWDENDIAKAREFSRQFPARFAARARQYQDYLDAHQNGGQFVREAIEAKEQAFREWDVSAYRGAYDQWTAHPDDVAETARRMRDYLHEHPQGRYSADAKRFLKWWDKVSVPGQYRVTLRRGAVESNVGKYLAGSGPDLGVTIEVAGTAYGPSSVIRDSYRPVWDYTFPKPITWKLGDPITIRLVDYDWSASEIYTLHSRPDDPLAIRLVSGTIKPAKGGATSLVFASDFTMPTLGAPE